MARTGGVNRRDHLISQDVTFPAGYAVQTFQYLKPHFDKHYETEEKDLSYILDACSGRHLLLGRSLYHALSSVNQYKSIVIGVDIKSGEDILKHEPDYNRKYDIIVCNPPWKLNDALPIYNKLVSLLSPDGVMFFIINNVFRYQGSSRAEKLRDQKYYFLPRWVFKPSGRPLLDCGISVLHNDGVMPPAAAILPSYIPLQKEAYK